MFERREAIGDRSAWPEEALADQGQEDVIHGLWLLASSRQDLLEELERDIRKMSGERMKVKLRETGVVLRNDAGHAVEPFGFRDGLSMPEFFKHGEREEGLVNLPLKQVLLNASLHVRGGSFLVFRKLKQHVAEFQAFERELAEVARAQGVDPVDAGRLLIGRKRDGMPLVPLDPEAFGPAKLDLNRFDFAQDRTGSGCPFHAHIRKAFPRTMLKRLRGADRQHDDELGVQFVRRGVVYGTGGQTRYDPLRPPVDTGLLFLAYMSDIGNQFEFMQSTWLHHPETAGAPSNFRDPLIFGGRDWKTKTWTWSGVGNAKVALPEFVTPQGGSYLFVPPRRWLKNPPLRLPADQV